MRLSGLLLSALAAPAMALPRAADAVAPRADATDPNIITTGTVWWSADTSPTSTTTTTTTVGLIPTSPVSPSSTATTITTIGLSLNVPVSTTTTTTTVWTDLPGWTTWQTWTSPTATPTGQSEWGPFGGSCSSPGSYHCMPPTNGETWGTEVGVCSVLHVVVEHAPCGPDTVCKKRTPEDPSIYCVPPEFHFCEGDDYLPPANGTLDFDYKRDNVNGTCYA